jgi:hypothetical protein
MISFTADSTTETLTFRGVGLQELSDESWGIDNVVVTGPESTAVPEPASLALWSIGALGGAVAGYRRQKPAA